MNPLKARQSILSQLLSRYPLVIKGSLFLRRLECGQKSCVCHSDPKKRHGPYHVLSFKVQNRYRQAYIPSRLLPKIKKAMLNHARWSSLIDRLTDLTVKEIFNQL